MSDNTEAIKEVKVHIKHCKAVIKECRKILIKYTPPLKSLQESLKVLEK